MEKIEILLVDDNAMIRAAIKVLLDRVDDMAVVGEASSLAEASAALQRAAPTVVLTDLGVGSDNGLDLVRALKERVPAIVSVVLSSHSSEALIAEALRLGASAFVLKEDAPAEIETAIRAVAQGEIYLSASVSAKMIKWFAHSPNSMRPVPNPR